MGGGKARLEVILNRGGRGGPGRGGKVGGQGVILEGFPGEVMSGLGVRNV